jgi:hypothetical protein
METSVVLTFVIKQLEDYEPDTLSITPVLSGILLSELVESFERKHGFEPAGGYGALIPKWFGRTPPSPPPGYGSLEHYFMGKAGRGHRPGHYLLQCKCGNDGCWPLCARILMTGRTVVWDTFKQPHRPLRDYEDFGPFVFDAEQYTKTVVDAAAKNPQLRFAWEDDRD